MKLYMFEHCSLCFRVRMIAALKEVHLQEFAVLDDDTETMVSLVGKRVIPILIKDNGETMLESMDMVDHIDAIGDPLLTGEVRPEVDELARVILDKTPPLTMPRYCLLDLPEFATVAARDHYIVRKRKAFGDFVELRAQTRHLIAELMPNLQTLDSLIESTHALNGRLSKEDILILPLLRSAAVVEGLRFPSRIRDYYETMMDRTGFRPLPSV